MTTGLRATSQCIAWIGAKSGIFGNRGLDVRFSRLEVGGPESVAGLLRGDWDFVQTGTLPVAEAVLNGGDAVILAHNTLVHDELVIVAKPAITKLKELNGKRVGILTDAYSGQLGAITRLTLQSAEVTATYVALRTYRNIFDALAADDIQAGALPIDFCVLGHDKGRWSVFQTRSLAIPSVFATTRRLIAADRGLVLRVLRGFVETIDLFKTQAPAAVPLLQEFLQVDDRKAVERLHAYYVSKFPPLPRPDLSTAMAALHMLLEPRYPTAGALRESDIADPSPIDELDRDTTSASPARRGGPSFPKRD